MATILLKGYDESKYNLRLTTGNSLPPQQLSQMQVVYESLSDEWNPIFTLIWPLGWIKMENSILSLTNLWYYEISMACDEIARSHIFLNHVVILVLVMKK